ncbi:hypothetical protein [Erythrobacter sp.]|jgi:putative Ca2+/H+ antiporter (TMEM165/GDT1 family)|uniref:hypothetical protein n=1 Tax=Erythrobacter sp. TaxID=1042 RepID=UPI002EB5DCBB|nr:hypothetical protein [Erythrobacter sp.]
MAAFLLALILTFAIALGGREQRIVAGFADSLARTGPLLVTACVAALLTTCAMAYFGAQIAALLPRRAAEMLVAFALAIAAAELAWKVKLKPMREPTRSYIAISIVLAARQLGDGARFVVFALAAWALFPATAMIGGALGAMAASTLGWTLGLARLEKLPLRAIRLTMATGLLVAAVVIGLNARDASL